MRDNEDKASRYHRLRRRAELAGTITAALVLFTVLLSGASLRIREQAAMFGMAIGRGFEEPGTVVAVGIVLALLMYAVEVPFAFYQGYLLEHRYGLSNETIGQWARDQAKAAVVTVIVATLGASIVYATLRWNPSWWWAASAAIFVVATIGFVQIAPVLLLPMFYSFKPLDRPRLVERLVSLAERARARVIGVYEWALSAHTKKANAALAGLGHTRRILLSDTLLADYSDDEIEVVLAHELSHHVHHDLWRSMALQTLVLFAAFFVAHLALAAFADRLTLRGLDDPAGLPLLILVGGASSFVFLPIANALSRAHERRADRYALEMTRQPAAFIGAMKRLSQQNLAEEYPSTMVQWLFYSHPPIRQRIEAARAWDAQHATGTLRADRSEVA